jgi:hypothetical protein
MSFTFYGDLIGISSLYRLSAEIAHERLNKFYNIAFRTLDPRWEEENDVKEWMISDSVLISGRNPEAALSQLVSVYTELLREGLMLRGAIVAGELRFEPRVTRANFQKSLPQDDTLARAVGLERTQKGARLLIENTLAQTLLEHEPDWLTQDGYVRNIRGHNSTPFDSVLRRITPTPDGSTYELLYFWPDRLTDYQQKRNELNEIKKMVGENIAEHYKETVDLLARSKSRYQFTRKQLNAEPYAGMLDELHHG